MRVLGPYEFTEVGSEETNCGCEGDYCNLLQVGDRMTYQVPGSEFCAQYLAGCDQLTALCVDEQVIGSVFPYTQNADSVCFDLISGAGPGEISAGTSFLDLPYSSFVLGATYKICVKISNNITPEADLVLRLTVPGGTWDSPLTYNGNGLFCTYIENTSPSGTGAGTASLVFNGGEDSVVLCVELFSLCLASSLFITSPMSIAPGNEISYTFGVNGNAIIDFGISGETPLGCHTVTMELDAFGSSVRTFESNCISVQESIPCTVLLNWRNDNNAFGFDYSDVDYLNYLRIKARLKQPFWPTEVGTYLQSDNQNQLTNAQQSETIKLVTGAPNGLTFGEPEYVLRSIASALIHSTFTIDDITYRFTGTEFSPNWRNSSDLAHFEVDLINQDYDGINRYCG